MDVDSPATCVHYNLYSGRRLGPLIQQVLYTKREEAKKILRYFNRNYPHVEKNSRIGYFFVSDRDMRLYNIYRAGTSPVDLLKMPEAEKMSSGNLYRILNRVEWIKRHCVPFISPNRYDTKKKAWLAI